MASKKITRGVALDTNCVVDIVVLLNVLNMLATRGHLRTTVHICGQVVFELYGLRIDAGRACSMLRGKGVTVVTGNISPRMYREARAMEARHKELHPGDSQILAYAKFTGLVLITSDGLLWQIAQLEGVEAVNHRHELGKGGRFRSKYDCYVDSCCNQRDQNGRWWQRAPEPRCSSSTASGRQRKPRRRPRPQS